MRHAPVFQTDDIGDHEDKTCECVVKTPRLNGTNDHWICQSCGSKVYWKDRRLFTQEPPKEADRE